MGLEQYLHYQYKQVSINFIYQIFYIEISYSIPDIPFHLKIQAHDK